MAFKYDPQWQGPLSGRSFEKQTEDAINYVLESAELAQASDSTPQAPSLNGSAGTSQEWSRGDHQHPVQTSISGNAVTASKLQTPVNITLTGDVSGQTAFDGSTSVTISTAIQDATQSSNGLMTSADKLKLDGIETGANRYVLPAATASTLGGVRVDAQLNGASTNPVRNSAVKGGMDNLQSQIHQKVALTGDQTVAGSKTFSSPIHGTLDGNAATATKIETARTISLSGGVKGSASFDGSDNISISSFLHSCLGAGSPSTAPWSMFASFTSTYDGYRNYQATFLVENTYSPSAAGILSINARTNIDGEFYTAGFFWTAVSGAGGLKADNFVALVPDSDKRTIQLWAKEEQDYNTKKYTLISEGRQSNNIEIFTLNQNASSTQTDTLPAGTQYVSSPADYVTVGEAQTVSGIKTFTSPIVVDCSSASYSLRSPDNTSFQMICGGKSNSGQHGAALILRGADHADSGDFRLHAGKSGATKDLVGKPDGTLTWDGQAIQTSSDERLKTTLETVPDAVLDAWGDVCWGQFQYLDALERKGGAARLHLGLIAQRVKSIFEEHGLDACAYGILCHEERPAAEEGEAVDLWMVRYAEAQAMESAYQRRRADRLEARIAALEGLPR